MIHGYRQTEKAFREKTGGLRKSLKNYAEFVFCEACHTVPKLDCENLDIDQVNGEDKGWWFSSDDRQYNALLHTGCDQGFEQSLEHLDKVFESQGPFDGILAFSQGACIGSILCQISKINETSEHKFKNIKFKFAILVAGFKSRQSQHDSYYEKKIQVPTLHIMGESDRVIPKEMSISLLDYFFEPKIFEHSGGHFVPTNAEAKNSIIQFLDSIQ
ncbi:ovarian cancer-associated protein 2 -like [Brachionus plicatilis]|uniref:Ovarian cancer-associated protein 2-like n=1 Tax=Brachionus plicatilis TaxID=10195 RepID=A0A3M7Q5S7_BRAPC|nr:ovarian cancer-associated protein 2 -like [Brachionus plicatilis]